MAGCKIGNLKLGSRVLLAPMLEPNDVAFRLLCKRAGCGLTYTGMVSPLSKQKLDLDDKPALQLFGNSVRGIRSFMKRHDSEVSLWDFNLGCPSKLSRKLGHGAFMCNGIEAPKGVPPAQVASTGVDRVGNILRVMRASTDKPVTIKIRKSGDALDIVRMAERVGVDAICVHARTVAQGYSGKVDYDFALEIKKNTKLPVIFSGDVCEGNVERILRDFDFVMIGRASIGCPEIFSELVGSRRSVIDVGFGEYLKLAKRYGLFFRQIKYQAMNFTKGVEGGKRLREALVGANSLCELEKLMSHMG